MQIRTNSQNFIYCDVHLRKRIQRNACLPLTFHHVEYKKEQPITSIKILNDCETYKSLPSIYVLYDYRNNGCFKDTFSRYPNPIREINVSGTNKRNPDPLATNHDCSQINSEINEKRLQNRAQNGESILTSLSQAS